MKYREGKRCGEAKYIWNDGSIEISVFDDDGIQNGPAKLTWPNGAIREGSKVNMIKYNLYFWNTEFQYHIFRCNWKFFDSRLMANGMGMCFIRTRKVQEKGNGT